jgi:Tol biopolymer transport system component
VTSESGQLRAGSAEPFLKTSAVNAHATVSPDGRWIAYADTVSGSYELYVQAFSEGRGGTTAKV